MKRRLYAVDDNDILKSEKQIYQRTIIKFETYLLMLLKPIQQSGIPIPPPPAKWFIAKLRKL
ncbi:MAG: hypothetical protein AVDCRST_MAG96-2911, partial [uncultured Segetibacter sp.]